MATAWNLSGHDCAFPSIVGNQQTAAEDGDAIGHPHQARPFAFQGTADSVVADLEPKPPAILPGAHCRAARLGVFRHVRQRLAHAEVDGRFHSCRIADSWDPDDLHGNR